MNGIDWVDTATNAFTDALAELVGDATPQLDANQAGRRAALGALSGAMWAEQVGPFYNTEGVMALLGGVTKQAVHDRVRRHRLLALQTGSGRLVYPTSQFSGSKVIDGLGAVLDVLVPDEVESWAIASWLATADPALGDSTPLAALRSGRVEDVLMAARQLATTLRG